MFSQTSEYALRAAVFLAGRPVTEHQTGRDIAATMDIPADYLSKVMQCLARAGLVEAQRGKTGGFRLTRPAANISLLDVVNAIDPIRRISTCPLRLPQHSGALCPLHRKLDHALATIEKELRETSIGDLIDTPQPAFHAIGAGHAK